MTAWRGDVSPRAAIPRYGHAHRIRVTPGQQYDAFTEQGIETFLSSTYTVTPRSDRIGYRLEGSPIEHKAGADIVSDGIPVREQYRSPATACLSSFWPIGVPREATPR